MDKKQFCVFQCPSPAIKFCNNELWTEQEFPCGIVKSPKKTSFEDMAIDEYGFLNGQIKKHKKLKDLTKKK
ncbi:hypothetical protein SADUNF_Sadunf13G0042400 [Salix dunnii]|uniref:Uncharacterized protein n=1 Tax=Salix dunnii TaxID=1413687 RepID=A0A835JFE3_9ROSI|nr:hypothetical protein SADUNF_Sadunf13G0042400 [Salix dunnii]